MGTQSASEVTFPMTAILNGLTVDAQVPVDTVMRRTGTSGETSSYWLEL